MLVLLHSIFLCLLSAVGQTFALTQSRGKLFAEAVDLAAVLLVLRLSLVQFKTLLVDSSFLSGQRDFLLLLLEVRGPDVGDSVLFFSELSLDLLDLLFDYEELAFLML